jgi:hypothetical protein
VGRVLRPARRAACRCLRCSRPCVRMPSTRCEDRMRQRKEEACRWPLPARKLVPRVPLGAGGVP